MEDAKKIPITVDSSTKEEIKMHVLTSSCISQLLDVFIISPLLPDQTLLMLLVMWLSFVQNQQNNIG